MKKHLLHCLLAVSFHSYGHAQVQSLPDAGSVREQLTQAPPVPPRPVELFLEGQPLLPEDQGGMKFRVNSVVLDGNTVVETAELQAAIAADLGQEVDFGGLRAIVNKVSQVYRNRGYIFARAALPAQDIVGGVVRVVVLEGRYGEIRSVLNGELTEIGKPYLSDLRSGDVIEAKSMERAALLLMELPGYRAVPVIRPSNTVGAGDLEVVFKETPQYTGSLRMDNHGGASTGEHRALASVTRYRNLVPGDQLQVDALITEGHTDLFNAQYSLPIGWQGLRASAALSQSRYQLSGVPGLNDGESRGSSNVLTLGVNYPLIRDKTTSLTVHASFVTGRFKNTKITLDEQSSAKSFPISLRFSVLDDIGGGGSNFGSMTYTSGRISDRVNYQSPATLGSFSKQALDVVRLQRLGDRFSGYARMAGQYSGTELDSSERMSAGGPNGVRAFLSGEGSGDRGLLGQLELRYQAAGGGGLQPYAFVDGARMTRLDAEAGNPIRNLLGYGFGLRLQHQGLGVDVSAAWASRIGLPTNQAAQLKEPRYWASLNYAF